MNIRTDSNKTGQSMIFDYSQGQPASITELLNDARVPKPLKVSSEPQEY